MLDATKQLNIDEFWAFVNLPENEDKYFELVEGEIIEMAPPSATHAYIIMCLANILFNFVAVNKLGFVFGDNCGYQVSPKRIIIPDVSFVAKSRLRLPLPKLLPLAPDLAVEIISPSEKEIMVFEKARTYLVHGTKIVWVVFPDNKSVYVCTLATDDSLNVKIYDATMTLNGGDVLPNFSLPVADIFPEDEV